MIGKLFKGAVGDIQIVFRVLQTEGLGPTLRLMNSRDAPGLVQFAKYGICGVASVVVMTIIAFLIIHNGFPVNIDDNEGLTVAGARSNYIVAESIAFIFANFVAYFLNALWVFTSGKHSKLKEFSIFTAISTFSFVVGIIPSIYLIGQAESQKGVAIIAHVLLIVVSALVNFACRKLFVFAK